MNRNGPSGAGKRRIVSRNLETQVETVILERKGYHLFEPDWRRQTQESCFLTLAILKSAAA